MSDFDEINGLGQRDPRAPETDPLTGEPVVREGWRVEPRAWIPGGDFESVDAFKAAFVRLVEQYGGVYTGCGYGRHNAPGREPGDV